MDNIGKKIEQLTLRMNELSSQQAGLINELDLLMKELQLLKQQTTGEIIKEQPIPVVERIIKVSETITTPGKQSAVPTFSTEDRQVHGAPPRKKTTGFEEFIGKNLASKVGILVTIVGIFIGAKYAIEHSMISPVVRIILGYVNGLVLIGIATRLKKKYPAYSAVLMGGGLCVLYFITFIGYSFYGLLPQMVAFGLMLLFTGAIVYIALLYDRVIIAHLAQVGAYAIPFLLSDNSGRFAVLFTYVTIINVGILVLSFRKYWKSLFYAAYAVTWLLFLVWYIVEFNSSRHLQLAWIFAGIFFLLFYATFLSYKLIKKEQYSLWDVIMVLTNSFIFYQIGMTLLMQGKSTANWQGAFTVINAAIHFGVSMVIRQFRLADRRLYYLVFGLTIVFLTIAIPVQFDGNQVTLLWTAEAVLVAVIGRTRQSAAYEKLGAGLIVLSFVSLLLDWESHVNQFTRDGEDAIRPFLTITFITGLLSVIAYGVIVWLNSQKKWPSILGPSSIWRRFYDYAVPVLFLLTGYFVFLLEIQGYFQQVAHLLHGSDGSFGPWGSEISSFTLIVSLLYSMVFVALVIFINLQWIKNRQLGSIFLLCIPMLAVILLLHGLPVLNEMSANHFDRGGTGLYFGRINFLIRYGVLGVMLLLIYLGTRAVKEYVTEPFLQKSWWLMVYTIGISFTSFEYLHWMRVSGANNQYKFGLSIIWGLFALGLIVYGIWKKQRYIRLAAMVLLIITLLKLFLYDLASSGTLTKTVSFISLGVILLLVSYLYNRYKEALFGVDPEEVKE